MACPTITALGTGVDPAGSFVTALVVDEVNDLLLHTYLNGSEAGIRKWDVSDKNSPAYLTNVVIARMFVTTLAILGDDVYALSDDAGALHAILNKVSTSSLSVSSLNLPSTHGGAGAACQVTAANGVVYVLDVSSSVSPLDTLRIVDAATLTLTTSIDLTSFGLDGVGTIFAVGSLLYVQGIASGADVFTVFDFSTPSAPSQLGIVTINPSAMGGAAWMWVDSGFAYTHDFFENTWYIINATNPSSPSVDFYGDQTGSGNDHVSAVGATGTTIIVLEKPSSVNNTNFAIFDGTNPSSPSSCSDEPLTTPFPDNNQSLFVTTNFFYALLSDSGGQFVIYSIDGGGGGGGGDDDTGQFLACDALGGYLFVADNANSKLKIYDIDTDPASPSLVSELDLDSPPTDVLVSNTIVFVAATTATYVISIDDINNPELILTSEDPAKFIEANAQLFTSGKHLGINALEVKEDETEIHSFDDLDALNSGTSRPAFSRNKLFFADLTEDDTGLLRSYDLGGFFCEHIYSPVINADRLDGEIIRGRDLILKGVMWEPPSGGGGGGGGGITELDGDVTAGPGSGLQTATIAADAVDFSKMQDIATQRLIGRDTAGSGDPEEVTISQALDWLTT